MDFGALPPEINSARMYSGPGSAPLLAAASAWTGLAAELHSAAVSYASVVSALAGDMWLGPASAVDGRRSRALCCVDERRRPSRADRRAGGGRRGRLCGRVRGDGAPAADRGQPCAAHGADRNQLFGSKHPGDRGHRGPLRGDVGAGRRRHVCLCRLFGDGHATHPVQPAAAVHQRGRAGGPVRCGQPGRDHLGRFRAKRCVTADVGRAWRAAGTGLANGVGVRTGRDPRRARLRHPLIVVRIVKHRAIRDCSTRSPGRTVRLSGSF
jgi:hypothetical protein